MLKGIQIQIFDPWFWLHPSCHQPDLIFKPNCCQMYPWDHLALAPAPEGSRNTYLFVCRPDTHIMGGWKKTKGPLITLGVLFFLAEKHGLTLRGSTIEVLIAWRLAYLIIAAAWVVIWPRLSAGRCNEVLLVSFKYYSPLRLRRSRNLGASP